MGYNAKVGSFNIDTAKTGGQTQSVSSVGFTPKIVIFWWSGSIATGDEVAGGNILSGFGVDNVNEKFALCIYSVDGATTSNSARCSNFSVSIMQINSTGGANGTADIQSFNSDGFTIEYGQQFSLALRISYLALGGDDLTNTKIGDFNKGTSIENYSRTGIGFRPDAVLIFSLGYTTNANGTLNDNLSIGMATSSSNQGVVSFYSQDAQDTSNTLGYGYNNECVAIPTSIGLFSRDSFVSFDDDGFTFNNLEGSTGYCFHYIALKGGQYLVGDITTRTDSNDIAETVGFQPIALLFESANRALSTQDTNSDQARLSIGAATSTSNRAVHAISDEDNLADTETAHANYDSAVYANILDDAIVGLMDLKSIDDDGFTCVMDDTDPSECWVTYLAIGATEEGGGDVEVVTVMEVNTVPVNVTTVITEEC